MYEFLYDLYPKILKERCIELINKDRINTNLAALILGSNFNRLFSTNLEKIIKLYSTFSFCDFSRVIAKEYPNLSAQDVSLLDGLICVCQKYLYTDRRDEKLNEYFNAHPEISNILNQLINTNNPTIF